MSILVSPSILSADFGNLQRDIEMLNSSDADWIHCDVMDGQFVPNLSFGFPIINAVKAVAKIPLDVHLMVQEPDQYVEDFKKAGADLLTVHYEACTHLHRTIQLIKSNEMKAGVALNPHTPVHVLDDILSDLDLVLIMSVNPGFGGQKFIENTISKVQDLNALKAKHHSRAIIEIDGGVNLNNAASLIEAGAQALVAGSAVFKSDHPVETIAQLKTSSLNTLVV